MTLTATTGEQPSLTSTADNGNLDAFFVINKDSTLTIGQSVTDAGFSYKNSNRWLAYVNKGGKLIVNSGTFDHIDTTTNPDKNRHHGTLAYNNGGDITINGGTFINNKANEGGVVYNNAGSITVKGGTFSNNTAVNGGVLFQTGDQASLSISGGVFSSNKSVDSGNNAGGGVLFQNGGKTTITGGTFTGNAQTYTAECTNDNPSACRHMRSGGGAIHTESGSLTITGNVTFSKNYSKAYGWGDGGGAIYARGTLWIRNDVQGNKPKFDGNWAGIYDTQFVKDADNKEQVPNGGAGGAIFLQDYSTAYLMGGSFTKNSSGYLGGAIYTEENSTTYIAKAVAYDNIAGHFGGGLWLCPSGSGEASKGGNIALFDNKVDKSIDPNEDNQKPDVNGPNNTGADGTEAGADFAIMNPYHKAHGDTSFMLMDTWFTDRTESAVTWYRDGIPVQNASGYDDSYQNPSKTNWDKPFPDPGTNVAVTKSHGRYTDGQENTKIEDNKYEDHVKNLTLGWGSSSEAEFKDRGVALKAIVKGDTQEQESRKKSAKSSAAVVISGNKARLSGGAFGTNGNVLFSTPWVASWSKTDDNADVSKRKQLAGSEWQVSSTGTATNGDADKARTDAEKNAGGPFEEEFYPTLCEMNNDGALTENGQAAWQQGTCWKQEITTSTTNGQTTVTVTRTAIIKDNIANEVDEDSKYAYLGFDNNPDGGGFDINNIANGTYTVIETKAPTGYAPETNADGKPQTYTFTIKDGQAQWDNGNGKVTTIDKAISNKPLPGVSWGKIDEDTSNTVSGSTWKVTQIKDATGKEVTGTGHIVTDCVDSSDTKETEKCSVKNKDKTFTDKDGTADAGLFNITVDNLGTYKLEEVTAPSGYWQPTSGTTYYFTVTAENNSGNNSTNKVQIYSDENETKPVDQNNIPNQRPTVAWSKIASDSSELLNGSEWSIAGPYTKNTDGNLQQVSNDSFKTASVTDCTDQNGTYCKNQANTSTTYQDVDPAAGKLRVLGLAPAPTDQTTYYYELTETKAPDGFVLSKTTYEFSIGYQQPSAEVQIDAPAGASLPVKHDTAYGKNAIPNVRAVAALPLTGGPGDWAARDWLLIGGGLAVAAAGAMALTYEWRRRKAVSL